MTIADIIKLIISLVNNLAFILIAAYLVTRTKLYTEIILEKRLTLKNSLFLSVIFGFFAIYADYGAFIYGKSLISLRDLGPEIAGLIGGPVAGLGAGFIGGIHRYFYSSGGTQIACSVTTILSGLIAGLVFLLRKGKVPGIWGAVIFVASIEILHNFLVFVIRQDGSYDFISIIQAGFLPTLFANSLGMAIFMLISTNLVREKESDGARQRMEKELDLAREILASLLPDPLVKQPDRFSINIYSFIRPARFVGGDFYDYYLLDDSRLLILIGDVSDKGIPAALFVSRCKSILGSAVKVIRAYYHEEADPARILEFANEELLTANETCMFVTLFIGLLDFEKQELLFSNAAHTNPFIVSADGKIHQPEYRKARPLGLKKDPEYVSCTTMINPGDKLVLYTDGITEAMNPKGEFFSANRLLRTLAENHTSSPEELVRNLITKVDLFALGQSQNDDIAVVAMSYSPVNE